MGDTQPGCAAADGGEKDEGLLIRDKNWREQSEGATSMDDEEEMDLERIVSHKRKSGILKEKKVKKKNMKK